ncbi:hypothetical protein METBIDRAFT_103849 [Metschnikowia bicuspidata var. bicuspidata NRRL YB-4993]|uniref:Uncharacterized protein n=1 Tax=Metschnikowia bicuspidata var. bicuspidata NRRL YB-4993 TaxID=869754 RepID=A0A1A0HHH6_9ASCO|nr:hypothetical protein METBIDRAFT_103849 [Metschnikowia bicuspidata var. bicuspidata NRRL YB-4993]OBA23298.1 hypothetical protein METBIDRAFT_103849 [Metschnikowia bicuspidata var. bicuspidata NRRL YB-4993]
MKCILKAVPFLVSAISAASLTRKLSPEDTVRDHLAIFRQVLRDKDQAPLSLNQEISTFPEREETLEPDADPEFQILPFFPSEAHEIPVLLAKQEISTQTKSSTEEEITHNAFELSPEHTETVPDSDSKTEENIKKHIMDDLEKAAKLSPNENNLEEPMEESNIESPETEAPQTDKLSNTQTKNELSADNLSGNEDYLEDERLPSLLVDGLKQLLKNELNLSGTFEFPDWKENTQTEVTNTIELFTFTPNTVTVTPAETPTSTILVNNLPTGASASEPTEVLDFIPPTKSAEGKANLKSVLDMANQFRSPSADILRLRKKPRPKTYVEERNVTRTTKPPPEENPKDHLQEDTSTPPKEVFPETQAAKSEDAQVVKSDSVEDSEGDYQHTSKHSQQSLSDIRELYFQSLERKSDENLMTYFQRIYPELQRLVGKTISDEDSQRDANLLLARLLEELKRANLPGPIPSGSPLEDSETSAQPVEPAIGAKPLRHIDEVDVDVFLGSSPDEPREALKTFLESLPSLSTSITPTIPPTANTTRSTRTEYKSFLKWASEKLHKLKLDERFHNPFTHRVASEAPSLAEAYPSIIGAVIFALFLILL